MEGAETTEAVFSLTDVVEGFTVPHDGQVSLAGYLRSWSELNKFFDVIGPFIQFAARDVSAKVAILESYLHGNAGEHYSSVQSMIIYERDNGLLTSTERPSGARTLLRLHRALEFAIGFVKELGKTSACESFGKTSACESFGKTSACESFGKASACESFGKTSACESFGKTSACESFGKTSACESFEKTSACESFGKTSLCESSGKTSACESVGKTSACESFGKTLACESFGKTSAGESFGKTVSELYATTMARHNNKVLARTITGLLHLLPPRKTLILRIARGNDGVATQLLSQFPMLWEALSIIYNKTQQIYEEHNILDLP